MAIERYWVDAAGGVNLLSDFGLYRLDGEAGRDMPGISIVEDEIPGRSGTVLRQVKKSAKDYDMPVLLRGSSPADLKAKRLALLYLFDPERGMGKVRDVDTGSERELTCLYVAGLEYQDTPETKGRRWQRLVLSFHAPDPYWYDTATVTRTYAIADAGAFFPATFPFMLASSTVFASANEDNSGDVEAWPVWIITGPGSNLVLRNLTTGKTLTLNTTINAGETVTIDTTPGVKTVIHSDGSNLYGSLDSGSALWPLQKGAQSLQLELGSATVDSGIQMAYRRRYLGA